MVAAIPLVVIGAALMVFILLGGVPVLANLFRSAGNTFGWPFSSLGNIIADGLNAAANALNSWLWSIVGDIAVIFEWFYNPGRAKDHANAKTHTAAATAIGGIIKARLPLLQAYAAFQAALAEQNAKAFAQAGLNLLQAWATYQIAGTRAYALQLAQLVQAQAAYEFAQAKAYSLQLSQLVQAWAAYQVGVSRQYALHLSQLVQAQALFAIGAVEQWAAQSIGNLTTWTYNQLQQLRSDTTNAIAQAYNSVIQTLHHETTVAVQDIWAPAATEAEKVVGAVTGAWPGVLPQDLSIPTDIPLTGAAAIAGLTTAVGAISTYVDECGMPMCRNLSGLGNELHNLWSLFGDGVLLAFLIEAVEHPSTVAHDIDSIGGPIAHDIEAGVKAVVG